MKKIIVSVFTIVLVAVATVSATQALFSDEETSTGNTFTAGTLDLTVNGSDTIVPFSVENLIPGEQKTACAVLNNAGTVDGKVTLAVDNPVSNENGRTDAEREAGDPAGSEYDPTSYDANSGDGELWDQITLKFFVDTNNNSIHDFGEASNGQNGNGTGVLDLSSAAHITLGENLFPFVKKPTHNDGSYEHVLAQGENANLCVTVSFLDDETYWSAFGDLSNNHAMSDDVTFDLIFGLEQVTN